MKSAVLIILSAFFAATQAGNVCLAGTYKPSRIDQGQAMVFAAGAPCDDDKSHKFGTQVDELCEGLPRGFKICGKDANLVKIGTDPKAVSGCKIGLEIDGETYEGETDAYDPNGGRKDGPCDADCDVLTGIDGFLQFVGVPMCD